MSQENSNVQENYNSGYCEEGCKLPMDIWDMKVLFYSLLWSISFLTSAKSDSAGFLLFSKFQLTSVIVYSKD